MLRAICYVDELLAPLGLWWWYVVFVVDVQCSAAHSVSAVRLPCIYSEVNYLLHNRTSTDDDDDDDGKLPHEQSEFCLNNLQLKLVIYSQWRLDQR